MSIVWFSIGAGDGMGGNIARVIITAALAAQIAAIVPEINKEVR